MTKQCKKCNEETLFDVEDGFICDECKEKLIKQFKDKYKNGGWLTCDVDLIRTTTEPFQIDFEFKDIDKAFDYSICEIDIDKLQNMANKFARDEYYEDVVDIEDVYNIKIEGK